jgi:hypothetical protein
MQTFGDLDYGRLHRTIAVTGAHCVISASILKAVAGHDNIAGRVVRIFFRLKIENLGAVNRHRLE